MDKGKKKELGLKEWGMILAAGALLLFLSVPDMMKKDTETEKTTVVETVGKAEPVQEADATREYVKDLEERLALILSRVEGSGEVQVMITVKASKEKVVLKDSNTSEETTTEQDSAGGVRTVTQSEKQEETILEETGGTQTPYLTKELEPEIEGILILAEGSKTGTVDLDLAEAVQALFDIPAHKVKILKMKR